MTENRCIDEEGVEIDYRDSDMVEIHYPRAMYGNMVQHEPVTIELTKEELVDLLIGFGRNEATE